MRIIKLGIICIIVLMAVLTGLALLFPSHLRVTRSVNIGIGAGETQDSVRARVVSTIGDLRSWDHWEAFVRQTEPDERHYSVRTAGAGAWFRSGKLLLTLTGMGPDSVHCRWELVSGKRFESGFYVFLMNSDSVTVQEWMDFRFRWYPWERLGILLYDNRIGPVLEESLGGLKRYVGNYP